MTDKITKIYDIAEEIYNDVLEYVKSKGGFVDCQDGVFGGADTIYGYNCYGGNNADEVAEEYVYALKATDDGLFACLVPCMKSYREKFTRDDFEETFKDDSNYYWNYIGRDSDSVLFVETIMNIADFIKEY